MTKVQSYLTTHPYVRYLIFAATGLFFVLALAWQFGDGPIFRLAERMLETAGIIDVQPMPEETKP